MSRRLRIGASSVFALLVGVNASYASGHGPVFGAATPTLGKGGWAFDQAWMGQVMDGPADTSAILRSMIGFGITERLQISGSLPVPLTKADAMPSGRMMAMMSGASDFELHVTEVPAGRALDRRDEGVNRGRAARGRRALLLDGLLDRLRRAGLLLDRLLFRHLFLAVVPERPMLT